MNQVFKYLGYSKQAFHQKMDRWLKHKEQHELMLPLVKELRKEHPNVAARVLYEMVKPQKMGRDKFESFCFDHGLRVDKPRAYRKTTDSSGVIRFPNLIAGREFTGVNQAWSSDITYYQIGEDVYYLTFILDLCSRKIVGYSVSKRLLTTETTIPALKMALKLREKPEGVIFHSDGGGQYYSKQFLKVTELCKMKNSMCDSVYENAHAERINGTIKNQYLRGYDPRSYEDLVKETKRAVYNYNYIRPHRSLQNNAPASYENLKPAGGASSSIDNFCNRRIKARQNQKNHQSPMRYKQINKTVNVF
jgi:putative transposase